MKFSGAVCETDIARKYMQYYAQYTVAFDAFVLNIEQSVLMRQALLSFHEVHPSPKACHMLCEIIVIHVNVLSLW